ncbi:proliferating cell nuclear antigen (pcna) [Methanomassiliicoccus luminyensis]|uniref:proliferating cell nuclear antigen (pcna) n=1 Tax=Methanomassiliicoccus luminyensis TaxID=1080712 RepID=UPI00036653CE|nr:proliferating cell nuclear antigen (pcna) [Methanomassiliicoccus luminyensis]
MFHAKIKSETLKGIVDVVSTLVDEAKFKIDPEGMELKAVDPAHVAMVDMRVERTAFEEFSADDTEIGVDLDKIKEVLRLARSGDVIEMEQDEDKNRLVLHVGNITRRMNLVDTTGMNDPKVPNVSLPTKIAVTSDELQKGIRAAESVSDHIALTASPDGFEMFSEGDTDSVSLKLPKELLISIECDEKVRSLFPLDYFSNMVRSIPGGSVVSINLGSDYPVKLQFDIADKKGSVNYLLAPRIESD